MEAIAFIDKYIDYVLIVIPVGAAAMISYQAARKALSCDESVIADCNTKMANTIKGAIIAISLVSIIQLVKKYFM